MFDAAGKLVTDNFYWLSAKEDTLDWRRRRDTVYTPQAEFGDLTALEVLPKVSVEVAPVFEHRGGQGKVRVKVTNPENAVAFMTHLRLIDAKGNDIVPVFWEDNYFTLLPKESREVWASYDANSLESKFRLCCATVERQRAVKLKPKTAAGPETKKPY